MRRTKSVAPATPMAPQRRKSAKQKRALWDFLDFVCVCVCGVSAVVGECQWNGRRDGRTFGVYIYICMYIYCINIIYINLYIRTCIRSRSTSGGGPTSWSCTKSSRRSRGRRSRRWSPRRGRPPTVCWVGFIEYLYKGVVRGRSHTSVCCGGWGGYVRVSVWCWWWSPRIGGPPTAVFGLVGCMC